MTIWRASPLDFFVWLLRRGDEVILVDTGFDAAEAGRGTARSAAIPGAVLAPFDLRPGDITTIIVTHLHWDHAGGLHLFPNATLHMQAAEMAYATGPCMCHHVLRAPFTGGSCLRGGEAALRRPRRSFTTATARSPRASPCTASAAIRGACRRCGCGTKAGWLCLASDATHLYENIWTGIPFPIVVDLQDMLDGFGRLGTPCLTPRSGGAGA